MQFLRFNRIILILMNLIKILKSHYYSSGTKEQLSLYFNLINLKFRQINSPEIA